MTRNIGKFFMAVMLAFPCVVCGTEQYDLTATLPISASGGKVELKPMVFTTYYSPLETRVNVVTWDPCQAQGQAKDCNLVNPLRASNLKVYLRAFNAADIYHIDGCYVLLDLTEYKPLSNTVRTALGSDSPKAQLLRYAIQSVEKNTRGSVYYRDCEFRVRGLDQHDDLAGFELPRYLHPIIPACQAHSPAGRQRAVALNRKGMEHYRGRNWQQAAQWFSQAAAQDCSYLIALTNLASVLALQQEHHQAQSVLWRAYKLNPELTLEKLKTDTDYTKLKQTSNFYSAASPIGMVYRRFCYKPADPSEVNPQLPDLIRKSRINKWNKRLSVATAYAFESDFDSNGIVDWVYPLVGARLSGILVVFDGNRLDAKTCTATPLQGYDTINANRSDPCDTRIFAERRGSARGIRLESDRFSVNRVVCR